MSRMRSVLLVVLVAVVMMTAGTVPALALRQIQGTLSNFDVWNDTGYDANDFEVTLTGVSSTNITDLWDDSNAVATNVPGGVDVTWSGVPVPAGGMRHFGVTLGGNVQPTAWDFSWTYDGIRLPWTPPSAIQDWLWGCPDVILRDRIINYSPVPVWVQRRVLTYPHWITLSDLLRGGTFWNAATVIDPVPVQMASGSQLLYDFTMTSDVSYMVMYDVFNQAGERRATFLNAAIACPEPSSLLALAGGLGLLGGMVRRRKR